MFHANKVTRRLPKGEAAWRKREAIYKHGATNRGLVWKLDRSRFRQLLSGDCHFCGSPPNQTISPGGKTPHESGYIVVNGIDRLDNSVGYTPDNSVACCTTCNRAKRELSVAEFSEWLDRVVAFRVKG